MDVRIIAATNKNLEQAILEERNQRMRNLRENVKNKDVFWWLNSFLRAAIEKDLSSFPQVDEYHPGKPISDSGR